MGELQYRHRRLAISGSSGAIVATVPITGAVLSPAVDSVTNTVYVSLASSPIDVIDGVTNTVTFPIGPGGVLSLPIEGVDGVPATNNLGTTQLVVDLEGYYTSS